MRSIASERSERAWRGAQNVLSRYQHCAVLNTIVAYTIVKSPLTNTPLSTGYLGETERNPSHTPDTQKSCMKEGGGSFQWLETSGDKRQ